MALARTGLYILTLVFCVVSLFSTNIILEGFAQTVDVQINAGSSEPDCGNASDSAHPTCFYPYLVTVYQGTTVQWLNQDSTLHTVTSGTAYANDDDNVEPDGIFDSYIIKPVEEFSYQFDDVGVFPYFCMIHPWMKGVVQVNPIDFPRPTGYQVEVLNEPTHDNIYKFDYQISHSPGIKSVTIIPPVDDYIHTYDCDHAVFWSFAPSRLPSTIQITSCSQDFAPVYYSLDGFFVTPLTYPNSPPTIDPQDIPIDITLPTPTDNGITVMTENSFYITGDMIAIFGEVDQIVTDNTVEIQVISPETNLLFIEQLPVDDTGFFFTEIFDTASALWGVSGTYTVKATYGNDLVADKTTFEFRAIDQPSPAKPTPTPESYPEPLGDIPIEVTIPSWIKDDVKWWAEGMIPDYEIIDGITYMMEQDFITNPNMPGSETIPDWMRVSAGWWAQDLISDDEFLRGIQFLLDEGVIRV